MGKVNFEIANEMRANGATYEETSKTFGVSKQAVWQTMNRPEFAKERKRKNCKLYSNVYYKGLADWLAKDEKLTAGKIAKILYEHQGTAEVNRIHRMIQGRDVRFTINQIKKMLEASGMTFEQMFELNKKI